MEDSLLLFAGCKECDEELGDALTDLAVGASSLDDPFDGAGASRFLHDEVELGESLALLNEGAAAAVDNLEELYAAGLPLGLPGRLSEVALAEREELIARTRAVRALRSALEGVRASTRRVGGKAPRAQGRARKMGEYDRERPRERVRLMALPAGAGGSSSEAGGAEPPPAEEAAPEEEGSTLDELVGDAGDADVLDDEEQVRSAPPSRPPCAPR
eukprot:2359818-Prymnesium_polylepis.1